MNEKQKEILNKYSHYNCKYIVKSLLQNGIEDDIFYKIMNSAESIPQTYKEDTAFTEWYYNAINKIDELLEPEIRHKILEDCACCLGGKRHAACKEVNKILSITHCYCCGGHVKKHLETVLGKEVSVKVVSSIMSSQGNKNCIFELKEI